MSPSRWHRGTRNTWRRSARLCVAHANERADSMPAYCIRDIDWWGPVGERPPRLPEPWRGLDIGGPAPSPVRAWRVEPWMDGGSYRLTTGELKGGRIDELPLPKLRRLVRDAKATPAAARDRQAVRLML